MAENKDDHEMKRKGEIRTLFGNRRCRSVREEATTDKHFPPPLPLLSQTGSSSCVLKRSYTDNGRLVIQEVKVKHHNFFHAHRINGRLTLQLVKTDKEPTCPDGLREKEKEEEEEEEEEKKVEVESGAPMKRPMSISSLGLSNEEEKEEKGEEMSRAVSSPQLLLVSRDETSLVGVRGGGKCLGVKRTESLFQMTTPHVINS